MQTPKTKKKSLKLKTAQAELAQDQRNDRRVTVQNRFQAIMDKCEELFDKGSHLRHDGHKDAWLLCASALDNAADTANEHHFELESLEYWECAISSLESLCCYAKPRVRRWFKKIGFK